MATGWTQVSVGCWDTIAGLGLFSEDEQEAVFILEHGHSNVLALTRIRVA